MLPYCSPLWQEAQYFLSNTLHLKPDSVFPEFVHHFILYEHSKFIYLWARHVHKCVQQAKCDTVKNLVTGRNYSAPAGCCQRSEGPTFQIFLWLKRGQKFTYLQAYLILLCFADTGFFKINWRKVCDERAYKRHFLSPKSHFGNSHTSSYFIIIFVMLISDIWCYCYSCFGMPWTMYIYIICKTMNSIDKCFVCSDCSTK